MSANLTGLTLADARTKLKARQVGAVELARAHLAAMEKGRGLNAFITETPELALRMAEVADKRIKAGEALASAPQATLGGLATAPCAGTHPDYACARKVAAFEQ